jgi:hypothetical protein
MPDMDFTEWHNYGMRRGFCGPAVCSTHDGIPMTEAEETESNEGYDPCVHVIRPYDCEDTMKDVESNHSPSVWRK